MNKPVGGRGKKAPYETTVVRVPLPLVEKVERQIDEYREFVISGTESSVPRTQTAATTLVSYSEAVAHAKDILKQKKSARQSIEKLLQVLYGGEVKL